MTRSEAASSDEDGSRLGLSEAAKAAAERRRHRTKQHQSASSAEKDKTGDPYLPGNRNRKARPTTSNPSRRLPVKDRSSGSHGSVSEPLDESMTSKSLRDNSNPLADESGMSMDGSGMSHSGLSQSGGDRDPRIRRRRGKRTDNQESSEARREKPSSGSRRRPPSGEEGDAAAATDSSKTKETSRRRGGVQRTKSRRNSRSEDEDDKSKINRPEPIGSSGSSDGSAIRRHLDRSKSASSIDKSRRSDHSPTRKSRAERSAALEQRLAAKFAERMADTSEKRIRRLAGATSTVGTTDAAHRAAERRRRRQDRMGDGSSLTDESERRLLPRRSGDHAIATSSDPPSRSMVDASERRRPRRDQGDARAPLRRHRTTEVTTIRSRNSTTSDDETAHVASSTQELPKPALRRSRTEDATVIKGSPVRSTGRLADRRISRRPTNSQAQALVNAIDYRNSNLEEVVEMKHGFNPYVGSHNDDDDDEDEEDDRHNSEGSLNNSISSLNDSKTFMTEDSERTEKKSKSRRLKKLLPSSLRIFKSSKSSSNNNRESPTAEEFELTYDLDD